MAESIGQQDTLKQLIEAEHKAQALLELAEQNARHIVAQAHQEAEELLAEAKDEAAQGAKQRLSQIHEQTKAEVQTQLIATQKQISIMQDQAQSGMETAVTHVVDWVIGKVR